MVTPELVDYIRESLKGGSSEDQIVQALRDAGWEEVDVKAGFATVRSSPAAPARAALPVSPAAFKMPAATQASRAQTTAFFADTNLIGKKRGSVFPAIALVAVLLLSGGGALAYTEQVWPFGPWPTSFWPFGEKGPDHKELFDNVVAKALEIQSASYTLALSLASEPRAADAEPLKVEIPSVDVKPYERDTQRFRDLEDISQKISYLSLPARGIPSRLPAALEEVDIKKSDPLTGNPYEYNRVGDGGDFSLKIIFETDEAIAAIKNKLWRDKTRIPIIEGKVVAFNKNNFSEYYSLRFSGEPKEVAFAKGINSQAELLSYLPGELKVAGRVSGTAQKQTGKAADARFQIGGDVNWGDSSYSADLEFAKKGKTLYARLNKFPGEFSFFLDLSAIKGKWVKITEEDFAAAGSSQLSVISLPEDQLREATAKILDLIRQFFRIAREESYITYAGNPVREKIRGADALRYQLVFNLEKIPAVYKRVLAEIKNKFADNPDILSAIEEVDGETAALIESKTFKDLTDYYNKNGVYNLWIEERTGFPVKLEYFTRLVPAENPRANAKNVQYRFAVSVALADVNKQISIEEPEVSLSFDEAEAILTGKSAEEMQFEKQVRNVEAVRSALRRHKSITGGFPDSLDELAKTPDQLRESAGGGEDAAPEQKCLPGQKCLPEQKCLPGSPGQKCVTPIDGRKPLLRAVPKDAVTHGPFAYSKNTAGDDYSLQYTIRLPLYAPGTMPSRSVYTEAYSYAAVKPTWSYKLKHFEGVNTATKDKLSEEADRVASADADGDGLTDSFETYIGADKNKKDTDGDGASDGDELRRGDNPLGPGRLERKGFGGGIFF